MADKTLHVTTNDNLPESVPEETKKRIHEKLKSVVEDELSKETHTLGTGAGRPAVAVHASMEIGDAERKK
jgi:hypothetical protein